MSNHGRIHRDLAEHPKFQKASLAAIGLWTLGSAWTRKHRTSGYIPHEEAERLARGDADLIAELRDVGLWDVDTEGRDGFHYHQYREHNPDTLKKTAEGSAAWLVEQHLGGHPQRVKDKLADEVLKLMNDGIQTTVIEASVRRWLSKTDAPPSWLPLMVSDVVRANGAGIEQLMRDCWKSGNVAPLAAHGYVYEPADPEPGMTVEQVRKANLEAKRKWIKQLQKELKG